MGNRILFEVEQEDITFAAILDPNGGGHVEFWMSDCAGGTVSINLTPDQAANLGVALSNATFKHLPTSRPLEPFNSERYRKS